MSVKKFTQSNTPEEASLELNKAKRERGDKRDKMRVSEFIKKIRVSDFLSRRVWLWRGFEYTVVMRFGMWEYWDLVIDGT